MPRGGKRAGAGRPATGAKQVASFTLSDEAQTRLAKIAKDVSTSKSAVVESMILEDNMIANTTNPLLEFKQKIKAVDADELKTLQFIVNSFEEVLPARLRNEMEQKSIIADTMWYQVQREFDTRKTSPRLSYTLGQLYLALGIPKEFLDK